MKSFKIRLAIILVFHRISQSQGWFPVTPPQFFESHTKKQFYLLKRPSYSKAVAHFQSPKMLFPTTLSFVPSPPIKTSLSSDHIPSEAYFPSDQTHFPTSFEQTPSDFSSDYSFGVDFKKPKTQTFYKATLLPTKDPVYEFRYKIHDPKEENYQEKSEMRVGDSVRGYYSVKEPNGYIRLVKYKSDENGFQTQVSHHHVGNEGVGVLKHGIR